MLLSEINKKNQKFYTSLYETKGIHPFYTAAGLDQCVDLQTAIENNYIADNKESTFLILGAGDGREINFLLNKNYKNLYAVEKNEIAAQNLQKNFPTITVINQDIIDYKPSMQFDYVLWMWCGFNDFNKEAQPLLLKAALSFLKPNGRFILDSPNKLSKMNVEETEETKYKNETFSHHFEFDQSKYRAYVPSIEEIRKWGEESKLAKHFSLISYQTSTQRERYLFLLIRNELVFENILKDDASHLSSFEKY